MDQADKKRAAEIKLLLKRQESQKFELENLI